jgi:hypothetical protein
MPGGLAGNLNDVLVNGLTVRSPAAIATAG